MRELLEWLRAVVRSAWIVLACAIVYLSIGYATASGINHSIKSACEAATPLRGESLATVVMMWPVVLPIGLAFKTSTQRT